VAQQGTTRLDQILQRLSATEAQGVPPASGPEPSTSIVDRNRPIGPTDREALNQLIFGPYRNPAFPWQTRLEDVPPAQAPAATPAPVPPEAAPWNFSPATTPVTDGTVSPTGTAGAMANAPLPPSSPAAPAAAAPSPRPTPASAEQTNAVLRRLLTSRNPQAVQFGLQLYRDMLRRPPGSGEYDLLNAGGTVYRYNKRTGAVDLVPGSGAGGGAANIAGGINELATIPGRYGGDAGVFGSAVGPFQGDPSFNYGLGPLSRVWGSITSNFAGGTNAQAPPAEVRRAVEGATATLAQTLKPLIRKPGEGTWSDRDQAVLDSIVGNLTQARNVEQYMRELENVRQRIMSNFGVQLPPINPQTAPAAGGFRVLGVR
jgi:hypothetical protein